MRLRDFLPIFAKIMPRQTVGGRLAAAGDFKNLQAFLVQLCIPIYFWDVLYLGPQIDNPGISIHPSRKGTLNPRSCAGEMFKKTDPRLRDFMSWSQIHATYGESI